MSDLIEQLGIDWKLLLSQAINFFILLAVLTVFVYKPILAKLKERKEKIESGLEKAKEADIRLKEIDQIAKNRLKEAEERSIVMLKETENKARLLEQDLIKRAEERQKELMKKAIESFNRKNEEAQKEILKEAGALLKKIFIKAVEMDPDKIDDALIKKAVSQTNKK